MSLRVVVRPVNARRPRSTRSALITMSTCWGTVRRAKSAGNAIAPTPSAARALSIACNVTSRQVSESSMPLGAQAWL